MMAQSASRPTSIHAMYSKPIQSISFRFSHTCETCTRNDVSNALGFGVEGFCLEFATLNVSFDGALGNVEQAGGFFG